MKDIIEFLCEIYPRGWSHEDALYVLVARGQDVGGVEFIQSIRHEATSVDGILRETNGNYTLRSK